MYSIAFTDFLHILGHGNIDVKKSSSELVCFC